MKKLLFIIPIILILFGMIAASIIGVIYLVNFEKTPVTANTFKEIMEANKYQVTIVNEKDNLEVGIEEAYVATNDEIEVNFIICTDEEYAEENYEAKYDYIEEEKGSSYSSSKSSINNYAKYAVTSRGKYMYIARIDNTLIYIEVDEEQKQEIKTIIKELGY